MAGGVESERRRRPRPQAGTLTLLLLGLFSGLLCSPAAPAQADHQTTVTQEDLAEAIQAERVFSRRSHVAPPPGESWFTVKPGTARVLIVAPHATAQVREGKRKPADRGTGSLALMLNRLAGTPVIVTTYESPSDPGFYDDNAFKDAVSSLLRELKPVLMLDLHASRADRPYDVDLGTMHGQSLLGRADLPARLQAALEAEGLQRISHEWFAAEHHQTITKWVSRQGVPCIQLETNAGRLAHASDSLAESERFARLLSGLLRFIREVEAASVQ